MAYVLIVDDDEDFSSAVRTVLEREGYEVEVELEDSKAIQRMMERKPDLAILDVMFPENPSAGFEIARTMRNAPEEAAVLGQVPVLMLTAVNTEFPLGFSPKEIDDTWLPITAFLEKPVDMKVLIDKVASLTSGA